MGLFGNLFKSGFEKWVEGASHEELSDAYEGQMQIAGIKINIQTAIKTPHHRIKFQW